MSSYWLGVGLLLVSTAGFVLWAFVRKLPSAQQVQDDVVADNMVLFERQRQELTQELQTGVLTQAEFAAREVELQRALLNDVQSNQQQSPPQDQKLIQKSSQKTSPKQHSYQWVGSCLLILMAFGLPVAGWVTYEYLGEKPALIQRHQQDRTHMLMDTAASLDDLMFALEAELSQHQDNTYARYVLANAYVEADRLEQGLQAFTQAAQQAEVGSVLQSRIFGQYAQVLFAVDGTFSPRVNEALQKTLGINPNDATALGLLGIKAFDSQLYNEAIQYWQKALANSRTDGSKKLLESGIANAQQRLQVQTQAANHVINLSVNVRLANGLSLPASNKAVLFVYARLAGQKMPLLAARLGVDVLPNSIVLNDSMALQPDVDLAQYPVMELVAHVAAAGVPGQQPGDLIGMIQEVSVAQAKVVDLVIDQIVTADDH